MAITVTDGREGLILVEAIVFAIEGMSRLPDIHRPDSNIDDLKELLNEMSVRDLALFQQEARRRVDILTGQTQ
jgi:hypothetical protein